MKNTIRKKILVFGYFGYHTDKLDGQTIKTRNIYEMLRANVELEVYYADTQEFRYSGKSICDFVYRLFSCNRLIYIPAHNNLRYLFPIIYVTSLLLRFQIIYVAVGGWLPEFLCNLPIHCCFLKHVKAVLLENNYAVTQLEKFYGFQNVDKIPNFRCEPTSDFQPHIYREGEPLRLVFMARINKMKGLDTLVNVAKLILERYPKDAILIDFYGPINELDRAYFENELVNKYEFVRYCGALPPNEIVAKLREYDAMLFPTHFFTEGFPGTVLDAYRAGIPVIATKWKYATEFVIDGSIGYVVDFEKPVDEIVSCISKLYSDSALLLELKRNAHRESLRYTPDAAWLVLKPLLS